ASEFVRTSLLVPGFHAPARTTGMTERTDIRFTAAIAEIAKTHRLASGPYLALGRPAEKNHAPTKVARKYAPKPAARIRGLKGRAMEMCSNTAATGPYRSPRRSLD
ncbi:MAG TPA: hypothetical protein VI893_08925, partial [Thermoplasmata archaeon]|nr:hypothetical protein [Thermoplasmata archaeon]